MSLSPTLNRSTRGASKQRRDLINNEIERLKDLLPLSETIRQRLFQLQVMSLVCIYIRKERYLPHSISNSFFGHAYHSSCCNFADNDDDYDICKALRGFLLMVTRQGKLLYLSENAADYLAHSVEEIMSQGDSLYDLVDQRDHGTVQAELLSGPPSIAMNMPFPDERVFMCRMNLSRAARRHLQYHKFILMHGRYLHPAEYYQALMTFIGPGGLIHPVFASFCTPLITPENAELLATGNTMVFCSLHNMDMKFVQVDDVDIEAATLQANNWIYSTPQRLQDQAFLAFGLRSADFPFSEPILIPSVDESLNTVCVSGMAPSSITPVPPDIGVPASVKTKRKYSKSKTKNNSQSTSSAGAGRLSQCSVEDLPTSAGTTPTGLAPPMHFGASTMHAGLHLSGLNVLALRGLSPPTSDSTEDESRAIMVEIPSNAHHVIGLSSMLTPETSPANMGLLMNMTLGQTHFHPGHPSLQQTTQHAIPAHLQTTLHHAKHNSHPSLEGHGLHLDANRVLESPLPVIEPGALEAYLHHVESEGCIPVFGLRSEMSNKTLQDCRHWGNGMKPVGTEPNGAEVCRTFSSDDSNSQNQGVIPQALAAWHRSASWCPATSVEEAKLQSMRSHHVHLNRLQSQCHNNGDTNNNNTNGNLRSVLAAVDQKPVGRV